MSPKTKKKKPPTMLLVTDLVANKTFFLDEDNGKFLLAQLRGGFAQSALLVDEESEQGLSYEGILENAIECYWIKLPLPNLNQADLEDYYIKALNIKFGID